MDANKSPITTTLGQKKPHRGGLGGRPPRYKELGDPGPPYSGGQGSPNCPARDTRVTKRATVSYLPGLGVRRPGTQSLTTCLPRLAARGCSVLVHGDPSGWTRLLFDWSLADWMSASPLYSVAKVTSRARLGAPLQAPSVVDGNAL